MTPLAREHPNQKRMYGIVLTSALGCAVRRSGRTS